ncbi:MAG: RluA family pseudouridine synthase [Synechococcales cyanobacterium CRU_2_2]|nr:RluA family pseudouridine synthase [Synechococcales cyanobacterium CRU_2_2]
MQELRRIPPESAQGDRSGQREGKMYGVLLAEGPGGDRQVLKAFSGLLNGKAEVLGWVPPILGRDRVARQEVETLAQLEALKQHLMALQWIPERSHWASLAEPFEQRLREMGERHRQAKAQREHQRAAPGAGLEALNQQSRQDGMERRRLKQERDAVLGPLKTAIAQADEQIRQIKRQRKHLSQQLQTQLHQAHVLTNFGGRSQSLAQLLPGGLPTGTGECCAPKLLQAAAAQGLKPIAMAEFWWGASLGDKVQGEFYGACAERCQPLMGFLLSRSAGVRVGEIVAPLAATLPVLYEDEFLLAIDKPAGLLSVPGRTADRQDSALRRLRQLRPTQTLIPVHRLDQATSGILLFAKDPQSHSLLSRQFQQRQVEKIYEALVVGPVVGSIAGSIALDAEQSQGEIDLPLWGDPRDRPRQSVHADHGKPSLTRFRLLEHRPAAPHLGKMTAPAERHTRLELIPITGRTHQLRVHVKAGLGSVILGDRLYGCQAPTDRLHLHAKALSFRHCHTGAWIEVRSQVPF